MKIRLTFDVPAATGEVEGDPMQGMSYPWALGCDEHRSEDYPIARQLELDEPLELLQ